jgi:hypothetical protein
VSQHLIPEKGVRPGQCFCYVKGCGDQSSPGKDLFSLPQITTLKQVVRKVQSGADQALLVTDMFWTTDGVNSIGLGLSGTNVAQMMWSLSRGAAIESEQAAT